MITGFLLLICFGKLLCFEILLYYFCLFVLHPALCFNLILFYFFKLFKKKFCFCRQSKLNGISNESNESIKNRENGLVCGNDIDKKNKIFEELKSNKSKTIYKITWPIKNWSTAPKEVLLCSNWWNWTYEHMNHTETGFDYVLNLAEYNSYHKEEFLFKFIVDGAWQILKHYPTKIDSNGIENNYLIIVDD